MLSLTGILTARAQRSPEDRVYMFLSEGEAESDHLTCGEFNRRARALAAELVARCAHEDRSLLLFPPGLEFVIAFFGRLYAGVVNVHAYLSRPRRDRARLRAIARDSEPWVVLTTAALSEEIRRLAAEVPELSGASWVATDQIPERGVDWHAEEPAAESPDPARAAAAVDRMAEHFERLLQAAVADPDCRIQSVGLTAQAEELEFAGAFSGGF